MQEKRAGLDEIERLVKNQIKLLVEPKSEKPKGRDKSTAKKDSAEK